MSSLTENGRQPNLSICIIGAGFSGITSAIQLKRKLGFESFTIFESNDDIGGTWLVNKYPGCACDVNSHMYTLSFEPNPDWPKSFSSHDDIWKYMKKLTEKYMLYPKIKFGHNVKTIVWDDLIKKWRVSVVDKNNAEKGVQNLLFDIVINGPGSLRVPYYPEKFKGFKGPIIHSAEWDSSIELEDKVVAVVGSGSSAIQIIPKVSEKAKELHLYQRKPAWVVPQNQFEFSSIAKFIFAYVPFVMWIYRWLLFITWEIMFPATRTGSWLNKYFANGVIKYLKQEVKDEKVVADLTPNYALFCKRICISDVYYSTFNKPHVKLHRSPIVDVSDDSIRIEDGSEHKIEVLILATGFRTQDFFAPIQIIGRNGENMIDKWRNDKPSAYYGLISHVAPNHFMLLGPNTLLGNNSVIFILECQVNFMIQAIEKMLQTQSKSISVKASAEEDYMKSLKKDMDKTIWSSGKCNSWYANSKGEVTMLYPLPCSMFWWKTRNVDFSKFDLA